MPKSKKTEKFIKFDFFFIGLWGLSGSGTDGMLNNI